jgi:integrase
MASLQFDEKAQTYRVRFRFAGKGYFRSLKTADPREAEAACGVVESTINAVERGWLVIPGGADPGVFIVSGGKVTGKPEPAPPADITPAPPTLKTLFDAYAADLNPDAKEAGSLVTEAIHRGHLLRLFGDRPFGEIDADAVQKYVRARSLKKVHPATIKKELATLRAVWNWALRRRRTAAPVPWRTRDLSFSKAAPKEPFKTRAEIERRIERERLDDDAAARLWESLYLTEAEVVACLAYVRENARHAVVFPMIAIAAYTGARRGEIVRSLREDFDLEAGVVAVRQKKSDCSKTHTIRHVPVHTALRQAMEVWFGEHPGGPFALCTPDGRPLGARMATKHFRRAVAGGPWSVLRGFHVFRHSLASIMASKGVDQRVINDILGHSTEEMERRYRHLFPKNREQALRGLFEG